MRKLLTSKEKEAQKFWEQITESLARQQGPLEEPPRILSFDELLNLKDGFVWLETFEPNEIKACQIEGISAFHDKNIVSIFVGGFYSLLRRNYGVKYRCWTANPKEESRKEIKWK